jgi:hypothetical protein
MRVIKSRRVRWAGHAPRMREMRNVYKVLLRKSERKSPLGRHSLRGEDNIKMDLKNSGVSAWI